MWHAWESNLCRVLVGKPEGKRPLGRPRRRWEDEIRMDLREISWGSVEWIQLAQDRDRWRAVVNTVMKRRVLTLVLTPPTAHLLVLDRTVMQAGVNTFYCTPSCS
jgi:hypothetical protein